MQANAFFDVNNAYQLAWTVSLLECTPSQRQRNTTVP